MTKKTKWLLVIFIILILLPNIVFWNKNNNLINSVLSNLIIITFILTLFKRFYIGLAFLFPLIVLSPFETLYILTYDHPSDPYLLGVLSETNIHESTSLLSGITLTPIMLTSLPIIISFLIIHKAFKENWQWNNHYRVWMLPNITLALLFVTVQNMPVASAGNNIKKLDRLVMGSEASTLTTSQLETSYPAGIPLRIMNFMNQRDGLRQAQDILKSFHFNASQTPPILGREIHVLVIGETGRPDHWQLNGYTRPTTPRLSSMNDVINFTNVTTGWAWTRMSVPVILTRKPSTNKSAFFAEKSLVSAYREAGFKTYWFSVQGPLGLHESSIALHAHEADETRFLNPVDYEGLGAQDGDLLAPLSEALAHSNEPKQLIVLHTLGGHYNYADRYPDAFDIFKPSLKGIKNANMFDRTQKEVMKNSYDNSILYSDYMLSEVIKRLKATDAQSTMLYIADHGENLFDGECDKSGHGHDTERDFRVASIWWNSDSYAKTQPQKVAFVRERQHSPLSTENVFHTMLDAANIHYKGENLTYSLLHDTWKPHPRWTQTGLDFDTAARDPVCKTLIPDTH
jgi:glucan phosphoethanolaminetransferase (alkaline phosphatase superfamily)